MTICPCCSGKEFNQCCGVYLSGTKNPETPEQLMRSRYTAYTLAFIDYIEKTMKDAATFDFNKQAAHSWAKAVKWQGLEILNASHEGNKGSVEFKAHFFEDGKSHTMHEISEFHLSEDKWYYIDGKIPDAPVKDVVVKIGRNDLCPCGSEKKYKKCCALK